MGGVSGELADNEDFLKAVRYADKEAVCAGLENLVRNNLEIFLEKIRRK
jgi:hypothetical protein